MADEIDEEAGWPSEDINQVVQDACFDSSCDFFELQVFLGRRATGEEERTAGTFAVGATFVLSFASER